MRVTYQTCCGVDVHKSFLVATIIKTTGGIEPSYQKQRFSTFNNSILKFKQWLLENDCHDVCMESTGKYWIPVFILLEDVINVTIANPKWVKAVKGNKDDEKDSKWIGDLFRLGLVKGSYIPCKKVRILREYTRYRYKISITDCESLCWRRNASCSPCSTKFQKNSPAFHTLYRINLSNRGIRILLRILPETGEIAADTASIVHFEIF